MINTSKETIISMFVKFFWKVKTKRNLLLFLFVYIPITNGAFLSLLLDLLKRCFSKEGIGFGFDEFSQRRLNLLFKSIMFSSSVSVCVLLIALLLGFYIWNSNLNKNIYLKFGLMMFMFVPAFVHAQSWIFFFDKLNICLMRYVKISIDFNDFWAAMLVNLMTYLPMGIALVVVAIDSLEKEMIEAAILVRSGFDTFIRVIIPSCAGMLTALSSIVFILVLADFSIPITFKANVYALEIFAEYSANGDVVKALLVSIPLILSAFLIAHVFIKEFAKLSFDGTYTKGKLGIKLELPVFFRVLQGLALIVLLFQVLVPLINLLIEAFGATNIIGILENIKEELYYTLIISLVSALCSIPVSMIGAEYLSNGCGKHSIAWFLVIVPFVLPASITGIGLVSVFSSGILSEYYGTSVMVVLAHISRFSTIGIFILYSRLISMDIRILDAGRIFSASSLKYYFRIKIPALLNAILATLLVIFALSCSELGATLIVIPPGRETLTLKIYNYLHYGATQTVATMCIAMLLMVFCAVFLAVIIFRNRKYERNV